MVLLLHLFPEDLTGLGMFEKLYLRVAQEKGKYWLAGKTLMLARGHNRTSKSRVEMLQATVFSFRFILHAKKTAFVVEHDFIMATYLADRVVVFDGIPSIKTKANS